MRRFHVPCQHSSDHAWEYVACNVYIYITHSHIASISTVYICIPASSSLAAVVFTFRVFCGKESPIQHPNSPTESRYHKNVWTKISSFLGTIMPKLLIWIWVFPKIGVPGYPKMDGLYWKTLFFNAWFGGKPTIFGDFHVGFGHPTLQCGNPHQPREVDFFPIPTMGVEFRPPERTYENIDATISVFTRCRCLEKYKPILPKWWFDGDSPWYNP